jgi:uncharacterized membrane protein YkoI
MGLLSDLPGDHLHANVSRRMPWVRRALPLVLPRRSHFALLVAALLGASAVGAGERGEHDRDRDHDHDRARAAVKSGEALPLATVLDRIQRHHPGQVLDVELERDDGRWLYEFKLLRSDGQLVKMLIDARTAQVLTMRPNRPTERPTERPNERPNERP